jgi:hypothetical protein
MYIGLDVKYPLFSSDFKWNLTFLDRFSKNAQISNFMKIGLLWTELLHAEGQTDMAKLIVALRNFANAPKKERHFSYCNHACFNVFSLLSIVF